ncbi:hypothetical protein EYS09_03975 [Streptomyces kasugaensis]|uniref:Amidase domain-containing protein n=1 Tax=Streptomyces kasugaensis TaxID=1946 RepID=A0A4Q9HZX0_STRKA|nr:hypothetical protein EYS09_03975 [Streptomyces kasugaensis]
MRRGCPAASRTPPPPACCGNRTPPQEVWSAPLPNGEPSLSFGKDAVHRLFCADAGASFPRRYGSATGGQIRNPYVLDRSPCGSSSGCAVAAAAVLAAATIGSETDGSSQMRVREPVKPSSRSVPAARGPARDAPTASSAPASGQAPLPLLLTGPRSRFRTGVCPWPSGTPPR